MDADQLVDILPKNHLEDLHVVRLGGEKNLVFISMRAETLEVIQYALKRYVELTREKLEWD